VGGSVPDVDDLVVLQDDPERFRVLRGDGRVTVGLLPHHSRRGLGLPGVPPLAVARELALLLQEHDALPDGEVALVPAAAQVPGFLDEVRARLT
jgi:hypothetical protein